MNNKTRWGSVIPSKKLLFLTVFSLMVSLLFVPLSSLAINENQNQVNSTELLTENLKNKSYSSQSKSERTDFISDVVGNNYEDMMNFANLTGHAWEVRKVLFAPNGSFVASGSSDGSIKLWNAYNGELIKTLQRHHYDVISLAFSPNSSLLASGGYDRKINLWDVNSGLLLNTWSTAPYVALSLDFSPDGTKLAVGKCQWNGFWTTSFTSEEQDKVLHLIDINTGLVQQNYTGHTKAISSVLFTPDGENLLSSSWDGTIKLWNVSTGALVRNFSGHSHLVSSIALSPNGLQLASGSFDKTITIWNVTSGTPLRNLTMLDFEVWSLSFSNDGLTLAAAIGELDHWPTPGHFWRFYGPMKESKIQLWNVTNGELLKNLTGHNHIIESIDFSPDGTLLASGSWDWNVKLWGDYPQIPTELSLSEWSTSTPEEQGLNSALLNAVNTGNQYDLHSLLVVRNGKLVYEEYYEVENRHFTAYDRHVMFSATKSFTSALMGIAIAEGFIENTDQKVLDFFPDYTFENPSPEKSAMTIENLLTMTAGLTWSEGYPNDNLVQMACSLDGVQYVLDKTMSYTPGTYYHYNTGGVQLLSAIIHKATGMPTYEFAMKYLFGPLGMNEADVIWMSDTQGNTLGGIGLYLTPRNMAKYGQLYLNDGLWGTKQIVPKDWVNTSTTDLIEGLPAALGSFRPSYPLSGYGYQWWISDSLGTFSAEGYQGKLIIVSPEKEMVIVITSDQSPSTLYAFIDNLLESEIPDSSKTASNRTLFLLPVIFIVMVLIWKKSKKENKKY